MTDTTIQGTLDVHPGKQVSFTFTVRNDGDTPVELSFRSGQAAEFVVYDGTTKEVIWRYSEGRMFTQALREVTLGLGERVEYEAVWEPPEPGGYLARAKLMDETSDVEVRTAFTV